MIKGILSDYSGTLAGRGQQKVVRDIISEEMETENLIGEYRKIAYEYTGEISKIPWILGVSLTGGAARGFVDRFSDIDILIFVSEKGKNKIKKMDEKEFRELLLREGSNVKETYEPKGAYEFEWKETNIDVSITPLNEERERDFSQAEKWDLEREEVIYDPEEKIEEMREEQLRYPESERKEIASETSSEFVDILQWHTYGLLGRGDLYAAHRHLTYALDLLEKVLYPLNGEYIPPKRKWRSHFLRYLEKKPENLIHKLKNCERIENFDEESLKERASNLRPLWEDIGELLVKENLISEELLDWKNEEWLDGD